MRDPKTFDSSEDSPPEDSQEDEPIPGSELFLGRDDNYQYGSSLIHIQTSDLAKCQGLFPLTHSSRSMPLRRLSLELMHFITNHPSYVSVVPIEDNLFNLLGTIEGPPGTPYEKGIFFIRMDYPNNYPVRPPVCNFMTKIYHPNISQGRICVNILERAWSPALTIETVLLSICSMLSDPFFNEPLEREIAAQYNHDKVVYESNAKLWTQKYATGKRPTDEELNVAGEWNKKLAVILEKNRDSR